MQTRRTLLVVVAASVFPVSLALAGGVDGQDTEKNHAPDNVLVEFGSPGSCQRREVTAARATVSAKNAGPTQP